MSRFTWAKMSRESRRGDSKLNTDFIMEVATAWSPTLRASGGGWSVLAMLKVSYQGQSKKQWRYGSEHRVGGGNMQMSLVHCWRLMPWEQRRWPR